MEGEFFPKSACKVGHLPSPNPNPNPNLQFYLFNNVAMNGMRASSLRLKYSAGLHLRRLCSQELRN